MTLDDLMATFDKAWAGLEDDNFDEDGYVSTDDMNRAGITAVVKALRDDVCRWDENGHVRKRFKTILGDDLTITDCEWTYSGLAMLWTLYKTKCGVDAKLAGDYPKICFHCGKPIKLMEPK